MHDSNRYITAPHAFTITLPNLVHVLPPHQYMVPSFLTVLIFLFPRAFSVSSHTLHHYWKRLDVAEKQPIEQCLRTLMPTAMP